MPSRTSTTRPTARRGPTIMGGTSARTAPTLAGERERRCRMGLVRRRRCRTPGGCTMRRRGLASAASTRATITSTALTAPGRIRRSCCARMAERQHNGLDDGGRDAQSDGARSELQQHNRRLPQSSAGYTPTLAACDTAHRRFPTELSRFNAPDGLNRTFGSASSRNLIGQ